MLKLYEGDAIVTDFSLCDGRFLYLYCLFISVVRFLECPYHMLRGVRVDVFTGYGC
jgi:hypothetical protein